MRKFIATALLASLVTCAGTFTPSLATTKKQVKPFAVYYVDLQEILINSNKGKQAKSVINAKYQQFSKKLKKLRDEIQKLRQELKSPVLSKQARMKKENLLQQKILTYQQEQQNAQQQIAELENKYTQEILREVIKVVQNYRKEKGIPMIVDKRTAGIISADPKYDLTKTIINLYNKESTQ